MPEYQRRLPGIFREISGIKPDDVRVSVLGTVIDSEDGRFVLDDGTGRLLVSWDQGVEQGRLVRVIGRVIPLENGLELQAEVLQDLTGLDLKLFKKAREMEVRLGV